jgi:hypothetical protein
VKRWYLALTPFLYVTVRILQIGDSNPGQFALDDLLLILATALGATGAIYALVALAVRGRGEGLLASIVTLAIVVWLFSREQLRELGVRARPDWHLAAAVAALALTAVVVWWLARRPAALRTAATFVTLTCLLLALRFGAGVVGDRLRASASVSESAVARELSLPIRGPAAVRAPARDVYLILLDEYANAAVLREIEGFDNRPFEDSLRALGFRIPTTTSNYTQTTLSLPSLLNAAHVQPLGRELPRDETDPTLANHLLQHSRVARFFQARGYRFVFFPSGWWSSTHSSPIADSVVDVWRGVSLDRALSSTEFRRAVLRATLVSYVEPDDPFDGDFVRRTLDGVARLPADRAPVFAFAHVLSPHWPYVFDRNCRRPPADLGIRDRRAAYVGQLECLNGIVLATVTRLIRDSDVPPVILLQGDHGSPIEYAKAATTLANVTPRAAWERFGAFGAYYLPGEGAAAMGDTVTVVNVLGDVLRGYFEADLPPEPDERFLSVEKAPFDFLHVDPAWLARGDPARTGALGAQVTR